ncbi:MAG: GGDEF domain-containing protein [Burkholderiaceae bacterium]|nr:MAG: GGDEF domain-containing protein [Burkholderiaceae bacterium]
MSNISQMGPESAAPAGSVIEGGLRMVKMERWLAQTQRGLPWLGLYDGHTGLPNRSLFCDRLAQACIAVNRHATPFAVLIVHLHDLEKIASEHAHETVEAVVVESAQRLQALFRESDTIARFGQDEFGILLMGTRSAKGASMVSQRIADCLHKPLVVKEREFQLRVSIGIALNPSHGSDDAALLTNATHAMRRAAHTHRDYEVYTPLSLLTQMERAV